MIVMLIVLLAAWFGFELGRKWTSGRDEIVAEEEEWREDNRAGVRLNRIVMRR